MEQVSRVWFTPKPKADLWVRWKAGNMLLRRPDAAPPGFNGTKAL
jgi:hypothetical protein